MSPSNCKLKIEGNFLILELPHCIEDINSLPTVYFEQNHTYTVRHFV